METEKYHFLNVLKERWNIISLKYVCVGHSNTRDGPGSFLGSRMWLAIFDHLPPSIAYRARVLKRHFPSPQFIVLDDMCKMITGLPLGGEGTLVTCHTHVPSGYQCLPPPFLDLFKTLSFQPAPAKCAICQAEQWGEFVFSVGSQMAAVISLYMWYKYRDTLEGILRGKGPRV